MMTVLLHVCYIFTVNRLPQCMMSHFLQNLISLSLPLLTDLLSYVLITLPNEAAVLAPGDAEAVGSYGKT